MQTSGASFVALRRLGSMASFCHGVRNELGLIIPDSPDSGFRVGSNYYSYRLLFLSFHSSPYSVDNVDVRNYM